MSSNTLAQQIGNGLRARGLTLAVAESCTGGLVGQQLTSIAGSSEFLLLDAVTYSNGSKSAVLGVDPDLIRAHGAVSGEVASAMADGARRVAGSDIAVSITGIAGPSGGTDTKPVGLVYLALATAEGVFVKERQFGGADRNRIQTLAAWTALSLVLEAARTAPASVRPGPAPDS